LAPNTPLLKVERDSGQSGQLQVVSVSNVRISKGEGRKRGTKTAVKKEWVYPYLPPHFAPRPANVSILLRIRPSELR